MLRMSSGRIIRIGAVEPSQFLVDGIFGEVFGVDVLGAELGLQGIDKHCRVVIAPLLKLGDVEGDQHVMILVY